MLKTIKHLVTIVPLLAVLIGGCSTSTPYGVTGSCEKIRADATTTYTGDAKECSCEADIAVYDYKKQMDNKQGIDIYYSQDNEMHAKSCQSAIAVADKAIKVNLVPQSGDHVYGLHYPMSKYTY